MNELEPWLKRLGLERYAGVLSENDVDIETLAHLTDPDLKELGFSLGHRRKLLAALAAGAVEPTVSASQDSTHEDEREAERAPADGHVLRSCRINGSFRDARPGGPP
jgi:hypothetical protein